MHCSCGQQRRTTEWLYCPRCGSSFVARPVSSGGRSAGGGQSSAALRRPLQSGPVRSTPMNLVDHPEASPFYVPPQPMSGRAQLRPVSRDPKSNLSSPEFRLG